MDDPSRTSTIDLVARYSNAFNVGQNAFEFFLEFGQLYGDTDQPKVHTRIVTSPRHARQLLEVLRQSIESHERESGPIQTGPE